MRYYYIYRAKLSKCTCPVYVEFGANSADTVKLTVSYIAAALTSAKSFNILARQISCFAEWR